LAAFNGSQLSEWTHPTRSPPGQGGLAYRHCLYASNTNIVRLTSASGICLADALHIFSQSRFNNGQPVSTVHLQPMDGILLQRDQATYASPQFSAISHYPARLSLAVTNLTPGLTYSLQKSGDLTSTNWQTLQSFQPMGFSTNLVDTAPSIPTFYRLRAN
jgi:hypothetical protein